MSSSSPWDAYSQHTGLPSSLESYAHQFSSDMRSLASGPTAAAGMGSFPGESVLGYPKSSDLSAAANLNLTSPYASAYGQSTYPGVPDLGFSGSSLRSGSTSHSPGVAATTENLTASSPHGQFSGTPTSEAHSSPSSFSNPTSLYSSSSIANSIPSSPYAQAFGGSSAAGSVVDSSSRAGPFSPFSQSYGYPAMYGYNQMSGFPSSHPNSLDGMNRYMGGISSSQLMPSSAMGLYSNNQPGQMPFPYHPSMGWGPSSIPGFPLNKDTDLMSAEEIERYRYRQLSNPYFHGLPPGGGGRNFPPHALQAGMMRSASFLDDRVHSPTPKKPKKATEEVERAPTPAPKDPACFHSNRGIYLFTTNAELGSAQFYADSYVLCEKDLCEKLSRVSLPGKIQYVYNPLEYAFDSHLKFVRRFCTSEKYILFVGMNPGPFGMSQNGVPFGECAIVKEWLQIEGEVLKPVLEHPKRRVVGLECSRSEVTGGRFWQLFRTLCHTPEQFFRTSYVHNLCPFAFLTDGGKNVTPPQLTSSVLDQINGLCNATLVEVVRLLKCKYVVCIGKYALAQAQKALSSDEFSGLTLECLMHPSPINPAANKGWADIAIKQLTDIGIIDIIRYGRIPYQGPPANHSQSLSHPPSHGSSSSSSSAPSHPHHAPPHPQQQQQQPPHHNPYHNTNKQSPGHYGFQSPPVQQSYHHHSPAAATHGTNNHASPSHAQGGAPNQSPSHARSSQPSPAHHLPTQQQRTLSQSSPSHSSHGHSPSLSSQQQQTPQQQGPPSVNASPNHNATVGRVGTDGSHDPIKDGQQQQGLNSDLSGSQDGSQNGSCDDKPQESKVTTNCHSNNPYITDSSSHENGAPGSQSEPGSQGSETSTSNSPYPKPQDGMMNAHGSQMPAGNPMNPSSNSGMHPMSMAPGGPPPPHMGMGQIASPALQQGGTPGQDQLGSMSNQQPQPQMGGSPQVNAQTTHNMAVASQQPNSHMNSMNSHLPPHMQNIPSATQSSHLSGMAGMGPMNPYGPSPTDQMNQMGSYASGMHINSYSNSSSGGMNRMPSDMGSYGSHMGMQNPAAGGGSMGGVPSGMAMPGSQMGGGMFNPHMGGGGSMGIGAPEHHMGMHAGMGSMYAGLDAQQMSNHYADKPPDCS